MEEEQKKYNGTCPECEGKLYEVEGEEENCLQCENCYVSIDSSGGYTK